MPLKNTKRCFRHVSYYNDGVKNKKNLINSNLIKASQLEAERGGGGVGAWHLVLPHKYVSKKKINILFFRPVKNRGPL